MLLPAIGLDRYEENNVSCLDSIRQYSSDVPAFLRNRPKFFVSHCMKRIPPSCSAVLPDAITESDDGVYVVNSTEVEGTVYTVRMRSERDVNVPSCDCMDWKRHCLPCKHMLSVLMTCVPDGWNGLPQFYRLLPQFNLDPDIVAAASMPPSPVVQSSQCASTGTTEAQRSMPASSPPPLVTDVSSDSLTTPMLVTTATTSDMRSLPSMQSAVRQTLNVMRNYTYSIHSTDFLQQSLMSLKTQLQAFKANSEHSQLRQQFRHGRRLVRSSIVASGLRRRLAAVRAKRRAKKQSRRTRKAGMMYCSRFLTLKHILRVMMPVFWSF